MKSFFFRTALLVFFFVNAGVGFSQTSGITSGAIYTLKSKLSNKLLNVSNASIDNSANVDCWTNTRSDAQRWIITHIGNSVYTLTNVASGKLLHIVAAPADSVNVDQFSDTGSDDVKWTIKKAGQGSYYLKTAANSGYSLNLHAGGTADGTNVDLSQSSAADVQKWFLQKEIPQDAAPTAAVADKLFAAWYTSYNVESVKGFFWDNAEMMEVVLDAYEVTKDAKYKTMFDAMYKNFIEKNGADWMDNKYNDDIAWAVLFSVRGYLLTGNIAYREKAKDQFDKMYIILANPFSKM